MIPPPNLTLIVQPTFPYRPIISPFTIYELHEGRSNPPKRVDGGVCYFNDNEIFELNEHGIVYRRKKFHIALDKREIDFGNILDYINDFIKHARCLYEKCVYLGNIEIKVGLQNANRCLLTNVVPNGERIANYNQNNFKCSSNLNVSTATRCSSYDLKNHEKRKDIVEELICKILWIFDIPIDRKPFRDQVRKRIDRFVK